MNKLPFKHPTRVTASTGQGLQEYGLIAGLVVIVSVVGLTTLGQTQQNGLNNTQNTLFGTNNAGPVNQMANLLSRPSGNGGGGQTGISNIATLALTTGNGTFALSVDPNTGFYQLDNPANGTNTTSTEGDEVAYDFTQDAMGMLQELAKTGKLPDGTPLSGEEQKALLQLSQAGFALGGAQLWLGGSQDKLREMGVLPDWGWERIGQKDGSYIAWAFSEPDPGDDGFSETYDRPLLENLMGRYTNFQKAYEAMGPVLSSNMALRNLVNPIAGAVDQVSRNQFYLDPKNLGNNLRIADEVRNRLNPPLNIRGPITASSAAGTTEGSPQGNTSTPKLTNDQAIDYTMQTASQFNQAAGSSGVPRFNDIDMRFQSTVQ